MSRTANHLIEDDAKRIFKAALPIQWVPREQHPDYHIDYRVDVYDKELFSGLAFQVQLKGTRRLRMSKGFARFTIESRHLIEYSDKIKEPVFLIVVDVAKKIGFWLFVQQYIEQTLGSVNWRKRKKVTLSIPLARRLTDTDQLRAAVETASGFMAARHPIALDEAIGADEAKWNALDPRFQIELAVRNGQRHYTVYPKKSVSLTMKFSSADGSHQEKFDKLIEQGGPVEFQPGELTVVGSALFESLHPIARVEAQRKAEGTVAIRLIDAEKQEIACLPALKFNITGGTREFCIKTLLPRDFGFIDQQITAPNCAGTGRFEMCFRGWSGHRILELPLFDVMTRMFGPHATGDLFMLEFSRPGEQLASVGMKAISVPRGVQDFFDFATTLRAIAAHFAVNPILPDNVADEQLQDITILSDLMNALEFVGTAAGTTFTAVVSRLDAIEMLRNDRIEFSENSFSINSEMPFDFLGEQVVVPNVAIRLVRMKLVGKRNDELQAAEQSTGNYRLRFIGTVESQIAYRVPAEGNRDALSPGPEGDDRRQLESE